MRPGTVAALSCLLVVVAFMAPDGVAPRAGEVAPVQEGGLTAEELAAEPPERPAQLPRESMPLPVDAAHATATRIEVLAESGYADAQGRYVVDLLEQDLAYLTLRLETADGRPVSGATPAFSVEGTSQVREPAEVSSRSTTDEYGVIEFAVLGGRMGLDRVKVTLGTASTEILVNVISLRAAGFPTPAVVEGGVRWEELMQARVRYDGTELVAEFPEAIAARAGHTVKLSGFMMPLEPDLTQRRFILASNPPSCFFHVPGGPAGAVEVFAPEGIAITWDPVVLEGRFEPQQASTVGVVYRLHEARLIAP